MSSSALRKFLLRIHVKVTCQSHLSCRTLIWAVVTYNRSLVVGAALKLMRMHGTRWIVYGGRRVPLYIGVVVVVVKAARESRGASECSRRDDIYVQ